MASVAGIVLKGPATYPGKKLSELASINGLNVVGPSVVLSISVEAREQVIVVPDGSLCLSLGLKGKIGTLLRHPVVLFLSHCVSPFVAVGPFSIIFV